MLSPSEVLADLSVRPPVNPTDLGHRLAASDGPALRRALVDSLFEKRASLPVEREVLVEAFRQLGLGDEGRRLMALIADGARPPAVRVAALAVLCSQAPVEVGRILLQLPAADAHVLARLLLADLVAAVDDEPDSARSVADALVGTPEAFRHSTFEDLERCRRKLDVSAAVVYKAALERPELAPLHRAMLSVIADDGDAAALELLGHLLEQARGDESRAVFARALARARKRKAQTAVAVTPGITAHVGSCDGQGAFVVVVAWPRPGGKLTVVMVCLRASADVRDAHVLKRQSRQDLTELLDELSASSTFVPVPASEAADLVAAAVARTRQMGAALPSDAGPALAWFERLPRAAIALPELAVGTTPVDFGALLDERPEYSHWFFDAGDLAPALAANPRRREVHELAHALRGTAVRERLVAMLRHMAWWHGHHGEAHLARQLAHAAVATDQDFVASPVVRAMLERSEAGGVVALGAELTDHKIAFGDETRRRVLRHQHFASCGRPKGRDLARLDFMEVADPCLELAFARLPGERRPRPPEAEAAGAEVGSVYAEHAIADRAVPIEDQIVAALMRTTRLDAELAQQVAEDTLPRLEDFEEEVCAKCPVACLDRPEADVAEAFFARVHPVAFRQGPELVAARISVASAFSWTAWAKEERCRSQPRATFPSPSPWTQSE
jgi:hypothetical protein